MSSWVETGPDGTTKVIQTKVGTGRRDGDQHIEITGLEAGAQVAEHEHVLGELALVGLDQPAADALRIGLAASVVLNALFALGQFPGQALAVELYREGAIRGVPEPPAPGEAHADRRLEAAGVKIIPDLCWCSISEPVFPPQTKVLMTNSGKYAHYAPGLSNRTVRFGSLAQCAESTRTGLAPATPPAWIATAQT